MMAEPSKFNDARDALEINPSEGQVEKSVVFPILKELGYREKNIFSKVSVRVKAGSKSYETLQTDIMAKDDVLPTLIIEAKSPKVGLTIPDDYNQGMSYCVSPDVNTRYLFLTSGYSNRLYESDKFWFELDLKNVFANVDRFRQILIGKEAYVKKLPSSDDVEKWFIYAHNRMYAEDAVKPAEALHILVKLILIKTNEERGRSLYNLRTISEYYNQYKDTTSETKRKKIEDDIYQYLSECLQYVDTDLLQPEEKTISRNLSIKTLNEIVESLYKYTLDSIPIERKGSAFDSFLNNTLKGREMGQFFTHRNIVNFMVDMADPRLKDRIIDPACGTGGFIEKSFIRLASKVKDSFLADSPEYKEKITQLQTNQVFGIEKDGSVASLAKLSMSMNGDGHTAIFKGNGLTLLNDHIKEGSFDIALTNPPFGSKSVVQVQDKTILAAFDTGHRYFFNHLTQRFEKSGELLDGQDNGVLFLERCLKLLRDGGFLGIILHDGLFSNSSEGCIRQFIRENAKVLAVVKLSDEAFKPYSGGGATKTTILFCRKGVEQEDDECFFGTADQIGYKFKRHMIKEDGNEFPEILKAFKEKRTFNSSKWVKLSSVPVFERLDPQYRSRRVSLPNGQFKELKQYLKNGKVMAGYAFQSKYFGKGEQPLTKIAHLNNSLLSKGDLETIPTDYYRTCRTIKLEEDDILLGMDGNKEFRAAYIDSETTDIAVNQRVAIIRVDKNKISPAYVFFVLISKIGQKQLFSDKTQTATVAHLSSTLIQNIKIPLVDEKVINQVERDFKNFIKSKRDTEHLFAAMSKSF